MKEKIYIAIAVFAVLSVASIYVTDKSSVQPSTEINAVTKAITSKKQSDTIPELSETISIDLKEKVQPDAGKVVQTEDGKMVVTGVLPPELRGLNKNLTKIDKKLETAIETDTKTDELKDMQQLIQETDDLITRTNQRLGITTPEL